MADYKPNSHFFVDHSNLANSLPANLATDSFGPVSTDLINKYRTTSFVRASALTNVFAICDGQIMIQPQTGDDTKVNLILKPSASAIYDPIKIKYFIYRGVNKEDLIGNNILVDVNTSDPNQPIFLQKLWKQFVDFNMPFYDQGIIDTPPETFPAFLIGYDENQSGDTLIEHYFKRNNDGGNLIFYQIPACTKGEFLGNFTGRIGLDVVLDYGDYELTNQDELFKLDLTYARKPEHIFDITAIPTSTPTKVKRFKEYIHQFLDATAFWGSHIECGKIRTTSALNGITSVTDIFTNILDKYQTKNKLYFYIQAERTRTYNYYDDTRKVHGIDTTEILNETNGWPIIIKEKTFSSTNRSLKISMEININTNIHTLERRASVDVIAPNNNTRSIYPKIEIPSGTLGNVGTPFLYDVSKLFSDTTITHYLIETSNPLPAGLNLPSGSSIITGNPLNSGTQTSAVRAYLPSGNYYRELLNFVINPKLELSPIEFQVNATKACSTFIFFFANLIQEFPLTDYVNQLWPVNLGTSLSLPSNAENLTHWLTYDRNRLLNLEETIQCSAIVQNKIFFDNGVNTSPIGPNPPTKKRRLYIASIKRNTTHNYEYDNYNISFLTAGLEKQIDDSEQFADKIYNDKAFSFYRGTFTDGSIINSICLIHDSNFIKKNSYFQLGIIEEEFNRLVYDSDTVPEIIPPHTTIPQILPYDAENVFFHLEEDLSFIHQNIRKFRVGLWYEDNAGNISAPLYPTSDVIVYTMDGFTFFSQEFTDYQQFFKEFANAIVEFRTIPNATINPPIPAYNGEFGFDWLRIDDSSLDLRPSYEQSINGGYKTPSITQPDTEYPDDHLTYGYFYEAFKGLKKKYKSVPIRQSDEQYFIPYLSLFSQNFSNTIPTSPPPPFEAHLRVYVTINENIDKLEFDYDSNLFIIDKPTLSDNTQTIKKESIDKTITITCLQDFSETKQIRVLCYPTGISDKKSAQLAGLIIVNKNDSWTRKNVDIALISVGTDLGNSGISDYGQFMSTEITNLINILHQNLNYYNLVQTGLALDLTTNSDFKRFFNTSGVQVDGGFINSNDGVLLYKHNTSLKIHHFLRDTFLDPTLNPANSIYTDYFLIFGFDLNGRNPGLLGHIDEIGTQLAVLYRAGTRPSNTPRDETTLNHETMHGYGLYHTHKEEDTTTGTLDPVTEPEKLFTYPEYSSSVPNPDIATDNVMSYNSKAITLWQWQRKFIKVK